MKFDTLKHAQFDFFLRQIFKIKATIRRPLLQVTQDSIFMSCMRRQTFLITNIPYDFEMLIEI